MSSGARAPRDQGCGPVLPTVGRATSPFMALLMDPLAVKAQARVPRCSSVSGCIIRFLLRSKHECCCPNTLPISSLISPISQSCSLSFNSALLSEPFGTPARHKRQRYRHSAAQGLVATDGSLKNPCSSRVIARDFAAWDGHCRGSLKIGE